MKTETEIKIAFSGDLMIGGDFNEYALMKKEKYVGCFQELAALLEKVDIFVTNLEGPICKEGEKRKDVTAILSNDEKVLNILKAANKCLANLANNHIMDFGKEGLIRTINVLRENGIYHVGAGENKYEAEKEIIIDLKGKRIGFLAYTSDAPHIRAVIAKNGSPGCASYNNFENVVEKIKSLEARVDLVCVLLHWGFEYYQYPAIDQVRMARTMIDAGASLIIGHHPHVLQGIERHNNGLIFYSLGNLFFSRIRSTSGRLKWEKPLAKEIMVAEYIVHTSGENNFELVGGRLEVEYQIKLFEKRTQEKFIGKMEELSVPICSPDYEKIWSEYKKRRKRELEKENLLEALKKGIMTPKKELIRTMSITDVKRNILRLFKLAIKSQ